VHAKIAQTASFGHPFHTDGPNQNFLQAENRRGAGRRRAAGDNPRNNAKTRGQMRKAHRAIARLVEIFRGLGSNFKFTNRFQIIYDRLFRRNLSLTHYIWKHRFTFICNSKLGDHISVQECFCERVYDALLDKCQFPSNRLSYVNVGANIGAFDLLLLERGLTVEAGLAVELNPLTFTRCQVNLQANGLFATRLVNAGIAGKNGSFSFTPRTLSLADSIFATPERGLAAMPVELLTLESLIARHGDHLPQFDLLKLDCEQAEYEVIRTAPASLLARFRYIIIEFHTEPAGESISAAYAKLKEAGFDPLLNPAGKYFYTDLFTRR
jgi:FkbM family methyltransferase